MLIVCCKQIGGRIHNGCVLFCPKLAILSYSPLNEQPSLGYGAIGTTPLIFMKALRRAWETFSMIRASRVSSALSLIAFYQPLSVCGVPFQQRSKWSDLSTVSRIHSLIGSRYCPTVGLSTEKQMILTDLQLRSQAYWLSHRSLDYTIPNLLTLKMCRQP